MAICAVFQFPGMTQEHYAERPLYFGQGRNSCRPSNASMS